MVGGSVTVGYGGVGVASHSAAVATNVSTTNTAGVFVGHALGSTETVAAGVALAITSPAAYMPALTGAGAGGIVCGVADSVG
jgi:hypothetical protein